MLRIGFLLWLAALGGASACGSGGLAEPECDRSWSERPPAVSGHIYRDGDGSDDSLYACGYDRADRYLEGLEVGLRGRNGQWSTTTCHDGSFGFGGLEAGLYQVQPRLAAGALVTTANRPTRLPAALDAGHLHVLAIGDSLPVEGDAVRFPERLAERLEALAAVTLDNVAVGGSTSEDWLPDGRYFDERIEPLIAQADLVLVSLGGNDILEWADAKFSAGDFDDIEAEFDALLAAVLDNVLTIVHALRRHNPDVDVLYLVYPNYAVSQRWAEWVGPFQDYVSDMLAAGIERMRAEIAPAERIGLIDIYGAVTERELALDPLLADELHFNAAGHALVADEALKTLAIARIGAEPLGTELTFGVME